MDAEEYAYSTVVDLATAVAAGDVSPVELVEHAIERIEERNPSLNAVVYKGYDDARAAAQEAEQAVRRGDDLGCLHGIPTLMKDCFDFKPGWITTFGGIREFADFVSQDTCVWVERVEAAGGIVVGKTNSPVMGFRGVTDNPLFGPSCNPFDTRYNTGGSSGGSAAAVADGLVPFAEGTDGGGSTRIPSAWCGTYGFKASFGRTPWVTRPNAWGGSTPTLNEGPITRTVADAALVMEALAGYDPRDPWSLREQVDWRGAVDGSIEGMRIAYSPDYDVFPIDPRVAATVEEAVRSFEDRGAIVEEVKLGLDADQLELGRLWCHMIMPANILAFENFKRLGYDLLAGDSIPPAFRAWYERCEHLGFRELAADQAMRTRAFEAVQGVFANHDLLVGPTLTAMPPLNADDGDTMGPSEVNGIEIEPSIGFCPTYITNYTGHPSASAPAGLADGLPVGLHIVGPMLRDDVVLTASRAYEEARPWMDAYEVCRSRSL